PVGGKRYQVGTGAEPVWLSGRELAFTMFGGDSVAEARVTIDASGGAPVFRKRVWAALPDYVGTAGQSAQLTPDGRVLYVRSADLEPRPFLTVVPNWVRQMERAVDEANR
ncbi:MAG TPA: hypothetical protein VNH46_02870, partial [Gemmatimonadales bacterium]|nr:hypothetical protein [Gemmatimonadales bacterium]